MIYLDTHVVVWLYAGLRSLFSPFLAKRLNESDLLISPIVVLELEYLRETGRTSESGQVVVDELAKRIGLQVCDARFADVVGLAAQYSWTRDPFDRLIVAQAALRDCHLMTKDRTIREHYALALWTEG